MENNLIELNNCGVVRNQKWLVRGVSLKVSQGEIVTLIGPNGSGKSTTLYSILKEVSKPHLNILTAEDPVEYELDGVGQVQIKDDIGLSFAAALRSFFPFL